MGNTNEMPKIGDLKRMVLHEDNGHYEEDTKLFLLRTKRAPERPYKDGYWELQETKTGKVYDAHFFKPDGRCKGWRKEGGWRIQKCPLTPASPPRQPTIWVEVAL